MDQMATPSSTMATPWQLKFYFEMFSWMPSNRTHFTRLNTQWFCHLKITVVRGSRKYWLNTFAMSWEVSIFFLEHVWSNTCLECRDTQFESWTGLTKGDHGLLGCGAIWSCKWLPAFQRNTLASSSDWRNCLQQHLTSKSKILQLTSSLFSETQVLCLFWQKF